MPGEQSMCKNAAAAGLSVPQGGDGGVARKALASFCTAAFESPEDGTALASVASASTSADATGSATATGGGGGPRRPTTAAQCPSAAQIVTTWRSSGRRRGVGRHASCQCSSQENASPAAETA